MYIDLTYYLDNGGAYMPDAAFARLEYRARKIVDRFTQGRVAKMAAVPEAVKMLMIELIGLEQNQGDSAVDNQPVSSFSNDGYSETYADPLTWERVKEMESNLVSEYLSDECDDNGVPLLFLGVG